MSLSRSLFIYWVPLVLLVCSASAATWTTIEVPDSTWTFASDINSNGDIVGAYVDANDVQHAYLLHDSVVTTIDPPDFFYSNATGINDNGQIVGWFVDHGSLEHGFLYQAGTLTVFDFPDAVFTNPSRINDSGQMVGDYTLSDGNTHGFKGVIGHLATVDVPGAAFTLLRGINNRGHIVGVYEDAKSKRHSFLITPQGQIRVFAFSAGPGASDINDQKMVVGTDEDGGFRYNLTNRRLHQMRHPQERLTTYCEGISNTGKIVGFYYINDGTTRGFLWTP